MPLLSLAGNGNFFLFHIPTSATNLAGRENVWLIVDWGFNSPLLIINFVNNLFVNC